MPITKDKLSGSTDGQGILVAATATPGTLIHTAVTGTGADNFDEVWLWAMNTDATARKLTIEYGGAAAGDLIEKTIAAEDGLVLVMPGFVLQNAKVVRAFAALTNVVALMGFVNKIRP
jgi:hypothetical protein